MGLHYAILPTYTLYVALNQGTRLGLEHWLGLKGAEPVPVTFDL